MEDLYRDLSILSEPVRVRLLALLDREELGVGELTRILQLPQSTVSRHLKALRVAGWTRRRSEGTSGLFRVREELPDEGRALWEVVRAAFLATLQHAEDDARLQVVLAERAESGEGFFGRVAETWDSMRQELFGSGFLLPALLALLPDDLVVADLGCGTGPALVELAPVVRAVIGVDREERMLEVARRRTEGLGNVELRRGGLEALPLDDGEVDAATCVLVLHHVEDPGAALAEARRTLRAGGRLVVVDMVAHDRADWRHTMGHRHLGFAREALVDEAERAGLVLQRWRELAPEPGAQGPPLFVAVFRARHDGSQGLAGGGASG